MKIVFVLEHYFPYLGGAEKLFKQLAEALAQKGHEVIVVTTQHQPDLSLSELINGVHIQRVKCYNRFLFTLLSLPAINRAVKGADLIHTTTYNAAIPAWLIAKWQRKRVVITFHEYWGKLWFELPFLSNLQKLLFFSFEQLVRRLRFDHYIAVSEATRTSLIGAGIAKADISCIHNGIQYERFAAYEHQPLTDGIFRALYFGRLGVSKGLDILIPAWGEFARKREDVCLQLVVPTYPKALFERIQVMVAAHCPVASVEFHHELAEEELFQLVSQAQAVTIPSYSEGFCFVAAETMAVGTPIIHSGRGALAEVVTGKYLELEALNTTAMLAALKAAKAANWKEIPLREFPLVQAANAYLSLITKIAQVV